MQAKTTIVDLGARAGSTDMIWTGASSHLNHASSVIRCIVIGRSRMSKRANPTKTGNINHEFILANLQTPVSSHDNL